MVIQIHQLNDITLFGILNNIVCFAGGCDNKSLPPSGGDFITHYNIVSSQDILNNCNDGNLISRIYETNIELHIIS